MIKFGLVCPNWIGKIYKLGKIRIWQCTYLLKIESMFLALLSKLFVLVLDFFEITFNIWDIGVYQIEGSSLTMKYTYMCLLLSCSVDMAKNCSDKFRKLLIKLCDDFLISSFYRQHFWGQFYNIIILYFFG